SAVTISGVSDTSWTFNFSAPTTAALVPGMYEGTLDEPTPSRPGLSLGNAYGSALTGRFVVLEAVYDVNVVQSFAADFELHYNGQPALFGSVRFNSTLAVVPKLSAGNVVLY